MARHLGMTLVAMVLGFPSLAAAQVDEPYDADVVVPPASVVEPGDPPLAQPTPAAQDPPHPHGVVSHHRTRPGFFKRLFRLSHDPSPRYYDTRAYDPQMYPRYTGAFHNSYFNKIGVPSGDVGFRGNGVYWTPW